MDNLTQQQYESVLLYMQDMHEDNFQEAYKIMSENDFDIEAVRERRRNQADGDGDGEIREEEEDQEIFKMRKFLLRKANNRRKTSKLSTCTTCIRNLCLNLTQKFIPQLIKRKVIRSHFYQLYQDQAVIELRHRNLQEALAEARKGKRKIFVIVSGRERDQGIVEFLRRKRLLLGVEEEYEVLGIMESQFREQFRQLSPQSPTRKPSSSSLSSSTNTSTHPLSPHPLSSLETPSILILRERHTEDLQLVQQFPAKEIPLITEQTLTVLQQKIKVQMNRESALLRRITERLFQESYNALQGEGVGQGMGMGMGLGRRRRGMQRVGGQDRDQEEDRERDQDVERFVNNRRESKLIAQQNRQYLQLQRKKKQSEQLQKQKENELHQYIEQRKCRKLSLPEQPAPETPPSSILKIVFRCPNGENLSRKFDNNQKCQILFLWVQLNDQIQFEGDQFVELGQEKEGREGREKEGKGRMSMKEMGEYEGARKNSAERVLVRERKFDLLYSYPPESLREKANMRLGDIFQGEEQIKILIRQM